MSSFCYHYFDVRVKREWYSRKTASNIIDVVTSTDFANQADYDRYVLRVEEGSEGQIHPNSRWKWLTSSCQTANPPRSKKLSRVDFLDLTISANIEQTRRSIAVPALVPEAHLGPRDRAAPCNRSTWASAGSSRVGTQWKEPYKLALAR